MHSFPIPGEEKLKVYDLLAGSPKEQDNSELRVHTGHGKKKSETENGGEGGEK